MVIERTGSKVLKHVSHQEARKWVEMLPVPGQRPTTRKRVEYHKRSILEGKFHTANWVLCYCKETDRWYRVNATHTSLAFFEIYEEHGFIPEPSDQKIKPEIKVDEFTCDTLAELAQLYSYYDSKYVGRSQADTLKTFASANDKISHVPIRRLSTMVSGIAYLVWGDGYNTDWKSQEDRARLMNGNEDFICWAESLVGRSRDGCEMFLRVAVLAAMKTIWDAGREHCKKFWTAVYEGSGVDPSLGDRVLQMKLMRGSVTEGGGARRVSQKDRYERQEMYGMCVRAFNSWVKQLPTDLRRSSKKPEVIKIPA